MTYCDTGIDWMRDAVTKASAAGPLPARIGPLDRYDLAQFAGCDAGTASQILASLKKLGEPVDEQFTLQRDGWARGVSWWITTVVKEVRPWRIAYVTEYIENLLTMLEDRCVPIAMTGTPAQLVKEQTLVSAMQVQLQSVLALAKK